MEAVVDGVTIMSIVGGPTSPSASFAIRPGDGNTLDKVVNAERKKSEAPAYAVIKVSGSELYHEKGGELVPNDTGIQELIRQLGILNDKGYRIVLQLGAGTPTDYLCRERSIEITKAEDGGRITDMASLNVIMEVLQMESGYLCSQIEDAGMTAQDITEQRIYRSRQNSRRGLVGTIMETSAGGGVRLHAIHDAFASHDIAIVGCLSYDMEGKVLNTNADKCAAAAAYELNAQFAYFITNSGGVLENGSVMRAVHIDQIEGLIRSGTATGGMVMKLRQASITARAGIPSYIGSAMGISDALHGREGSYTSIVPGIKYADTLRALS